MTATGDPDAWNPGIQSPVPPELRHLCTIFRPEHVFTSVQEADELHDLTGIAATELVAFRPQRLALHELLIRVSADWAVPDGAQIGDLGINFRRMVNQLLSTSVEPQMAWILAEFEQIRQRAAESVHLALSGLGGTSDRGASAAPRTRTGWLARLAPRRPVAPAIVQEQVWNLGQIAEFQAAATHARDDVERAVLRCVARILSAVYNRHGVAWGARSLIGSLAAGMVSNEMGGEAIGRKLEPIIAEGAARLGFYPLPRQERPIVMNTKGPSAAGKSSLRPLQHRLADQIGARWEDFALISPDIWRKQLLDYQSLGALYKYAGPMTGDELQIIDAKLDRYMARKNRRGDMTHLLIDRFRFDSFAPHSDEAGSNLLTRFGQTVHLFFVITPPESLVERAWKRGLEFGRFKAVGDTLAHSVQAYSGMSDLFFTWVRRNDKTVHVEFLDNSVPLGQVPRTVAFGDNRTLNVLDVSRLLDIERFRRINLAATAPRELYPDQAMRAPERCCGFLGRCVTELAEVNFADYATGHVYLRTRAGRLAGADAEWLASGAVDADALAGIRVVAPGAFAPECPQLRATLRRAGADTPATVRTLGHWGDGAILSVR